MKTILFMLVIALNCVAGTAQKIDSTQVGKIVYYEGKVELGFEAKWSRVKINTPVKRHQTIRIPGDGMAEITWNGGTKSIVGPNSSQSVNALYTGSTGKAKSDTEGVFNDFKSMFSATAETRRSQEGGIRRDEADSRVKREPKEVYWKEDDEITFSEAFGFYEAKEYGKAIAALQAFINQKPDDSLAVYAFFALGHSYIMSNNPVKAKEIFDQFVIKYPNDPLRAEADLVLQKLQ